MFFQNIGKFWTIMLFNPVSSWHSPASMMQIHKGVPFYVLNSSVYAPSWYSWNPMKDNFIIYVKYMYYEDNHSLTWLAHILFLGDRCLLKRPSVIKPERLFLPSQLWFQIGLWLLFMPPFDFHPRLSPWVLPQICKCSRFTSPRGFQLSHLGLVLSHLPPWVQCCSVSWKPL